MMFHGRIVLVVLLVGSVLLVGCRSMRMPWTPTAQATQESAAESASQLARSELTTASQDTRMPASTAPATPVQGQLASASKPSNPASAAGPSLTMSGVKPNAGPVRIAIFTSDSGFPKQEAATQKLALESTNDNLTCVLPVKAQTFAVAAFQDLNNDGTLNRSSFGIPTEPYGFSKNAGQMGPPSFADAAVSDASEKSNVVLQLRTFSM